MSSAVESSSALVPAMSPMSDGAADQISATVAATCGVAIEVPLKFAYPFPGTELRTSTPGAEMFGLMPLSTCEGPRLEKKAMLWLMSNAPTP